MSRRQQRRRASRRRAHAAIAGGGMAVIASLSTSGIAQAANTKFKIKLTITATDGTGAPVTFKKMIAVKG